MDKKKRRRVLLFPGSKFSKFQVFDNIVNFHFSSNGLVNDAKNWKPKKEFKDNKSSFHHSIGTSRLCINAELNKNVNFSEILVEFLKFEDVDKMWTFFFGIIGRAFLVVATLCWM